MAMMGKIRSMHFRQGKSISEIARLTSLSRNTINAVYDLLRAEGLIEYSDERPDCDSTLPYNLVRSASWKSAPIAARRRESPLTATSTSPRKPSLSVAR